MPKINPISVVLKLPETQLNFVLYLSHEEGTKGVDADTIGRILNQAYSLSPEMQTIIAEFADFLANKPKSGEQAPPT